ncbi:MAG TPA: hypothetical protein VFA04_12870 [Bryobacteraceae bacterium]|nr:hypothetical protein [Bryobacteraceae bacterium]
MAGAVALCGCAAMGVWLGAPVFSQDADQKSQGGDVGRGVMLPGAAPPAGLDPGAARVTAIEQLERMPRWRRRPVPNYRDIFGGAWVALGPAPVIVSSAGREELDVEPGTHLGAWTNAIAVHPTDPNIVYAGNPGSGVWKTTDGGLAWFPTSDSAASLAIGSIALSPSNPNVIYAGTGNWDYGVGILKSTDSAVTWQLIRGPFAGPFGPSQFWRGGASILSLAVHPRNPDIVVAGVFRGDDPNSAGFYRSQDGGATWKLVLAGGTGSSVVFNPAAPDIVYAAIGEYYSQAHNGFYKSTDGGITWRPINNGVAPADLAASSRIYLSLCASRPDTLYASITATSGPTVALVRTTDGGQTWTKLTRPPRVSRGMLIAVHPRNPAIIFAGDIHLFRSMDGGAFWQNVERGVDGAKIATDFRSFTFSSDGSVFYAGSDGGVWRTTDAANAEIVWTARNETRNTVLFYSPLAIDPRDVTVSFGGAQDLGILKYTGELTWNQVHNCDGGTSIIDPRNPSIVYAACDDKEILRSTRSGDSGSWEQIARGIHDDDRSDFIIPLAMDPNDSTRLLTGTYRAYETIDSGRNWKPISGDLSHCYAGIRVLAIAPSDSNTVYSGGTCGRVYVTNDSKAAAPLWSNRTGTLPERDLTWLVIDPRDARTAYVVFNGFTFGKDTQGHVFRTSDAGLTWTDISGDLPNIPVWTIALDPDLPGTYYVGTDIGVFVTVNGGRNWRPAGAGLPHASVRALTLHRPSRILRAATFGRGMWDLFVPRAPGVPRPEIATVLPRVITPGWARFTLTVTGSGFAPGSVVRWNGSALDTDFVNLNSLRATVPAEQVASAGRARVDISNAELGGVVSNVARVFVRPAPPPAIRPNGIVNAASFLPGPLAPGELVSILGYSLAPQRLIADGLAPPISPREVRVMVIDGRGRVRRALLQSVAPEEIRCVIPDGLQRGAATVAVVTRTGVFAEDTRIRSVSPGIFTGNATGQGAPVGFLVQIHPDRSQRVSAVFFWDPANGCRLSPVDLGPATDDDVLELYATGVRNRTSIANVAVRLGGMPLQVLYAGPQESGPGRDEIRVRIPHALAGSERVTLHVEVDGIAAQDVPLAIR